jgi:4-amino-4-deoxy-L-arabinose transferase-like glycosyltransferase
MTSSVTRGFSNIAIFRGIKQIQVIAFIFLLKVLVIILRNPQMKGSTTPDSLEYLSAAEKFTSIYSLYYSKNPYLSLRRTPGYPLLLSFFDFPSDLVKFLILQQVLVLVSAILLYLTVREISTPRIAKFASIFLMLEPSIVAESFMLLSETAFMAILIFGFLLYALTFRKRNSSKFLVVSCLVFGFAILVRPVAIILFVMILIELFFRRRDFRLRVIITSTFVLILPTVLWSLRNFSVFGVYAVSSIDAHNIHLFEGSGALSERNGISLEQVHKVESERLIETLGPNSSLGDEQRYRYIRGLTLIAQNFPWFIRMHLEGSVRVLFGPAQGELIQFLSGGKRSHATYWFEKAYLLAAIAFSTVLFVLFIFGLRKLTFSTRLIALVGLSLLVVSSGVGAYGRFRVPLAPTLCVLAATSLNQLVSKKLE